VVDASVSVVYEPEAPDWSGVPVQASPEYHEYEAYESDPPEAAAVREAVWPESIVTGETETDTGEFTVTAALVDGVAVTVGDAPPVVPVSVSLTVRTQSVVVPLGAKVSVAAPESEKPGQLPEATDHE